MSPRTLPKATANQICCFIHHQVDVEGSCGPWRSVNPTPIAELVAQLTHLILHEHNAPSGSSPD
eukprot:5878439-Amphidinium_carterae.1